MLPAFTSLLPLLSPRLSWGRVRCLFKSGTTLSKSPKPSLTSPQPFLTLPSPITTDPAIVDGPSAGHAVEQESGRNKTVNLRSSLSREGAEKTASSSNLRISQSREWDREDSLLQQPQKLSIQGGGLGRQPLSALCGEVSLSCSGLDPALQIHLHALPHMPYCSLSVCQS